MSVIIDQDGKKKFDLRTDIRDPKTGAIIKRQPYRMEVSRERGSIFIRNNVEYYANGDRVDGKSAKPAETLKAPEKGADKAPAA